MLFAVLASAAVVATGCTGHSASSVAGKVSVARRVVESATAKGGKSCWLTSRALGKSRSKPLTPPVGSTQERCDREPQWSPDGSQVAFVREQAAEFGVMVVNADGTHLHRVAAIKARVVGGIIWSPSGTALLFQVDRRPYSGTNALYRVGVDGSGLRPLAVQPDKLGFLDGYDWSPDGMRVVFARSVGEPRYPAYTGPARLQTISPAGSRVKTLLVAESVDWAAWSPDGQELALQRNCFNWICQLGILNPATGAVKALTHFAGHSNTYGIDQLTSLWRPGKQATIIYGRDRTLYEVSPATGATRVAARVPCPRKTCDATVITLAGISSDGRYAVFDAYDYSTISNSDTESAADRYYRVDLNTGGLKSLPAYHGDVFLP